MKKIVVTLSVFVMLALLTALPTFAQTALVCQSTPIAQAGDWLSKIAQTAYGDPQAYFPIYAATNSQAIGDTTFHYIDNPDEISAGWKLCVPAATKVPAGLDQNTLWNLNYSSTVTANNQAQLKDGKYSENAAPGSALMATVDATNEIAYGDVNGVPSAAIVLVENGGGSGVFSNLHLVQVKDGKATDIASGLLGDRVNLTTLSVQDGKVVVGMTTQGPNEPMCCGTERVLNTYALNGAKLDQASTQVVGSVQQEATTTPTPSASQTLTGTVWMWTKSLFNDGKTVTPDDPNKYLLKFNSDGTAAITADCNTVLATYTTNGNQLTITPGPSTLVACPPGSQADEFVRQLGTVTSYFFKDGNLILEFKFDSGSMTFAPGKSGLAGTKWEVTGYNNGKQAVTSPIVGTTLTLNFNADGTVSGDSGCNSYGGSYVVDGNKLTISKLISTLRACVSPDGVMDQEAQYLAALQNSATFDVAGNNLTIRDASGAMQVTATRSTAPTGLAGTAWQVTGVNNGNQGVVSIINGTELTLMFGTDGKVSGNGGCNSFNGSYESKDAALKIGPLASTRKACATPDGVMTQETQYLTALQNAATYDISGNTLTIRDASGATQVVAGQATAPTGLGGTNWEVTGYNNGKQAVVSPIVGTKLTLNFGTDGTVSGEAGCNNYSGSFTTDGDKITISKVVSTQRACISPEGISEQETQFLTALQQAATYQIDGSTLTIRDSSGAMVVTGTKM